MSLKITQRELKKQFKNQIQTLQWAIFGKCYDCTCFQADGYKDCELGDCPLYPYRLKQPAGLTSQSLASYLREIKRQIQQK